MSGVVDLPSGLSWFMTTIVCFAASSCMVMRYVCFAVVINLIVLPNFYFVAFHKVIFPCCCFVLLQLMSGNPVIFVLSSAVLHFYGSFCGCILLCFPGIVSYIILLVANSHMSSYGWLCQVGFCPMSVSKRKTREGT